MWLIANGKAKMLKVFDVGAIVVIVIVIFIISVYSRKCGFSSFMNNSFVIERKAQCVTRLSPIELTHTFNCPPCGSHMFVFWQVESEARESLEKVEETN